MCVVAVVVVLAGVHDCVVDEGEDSGEDGFGLLWWG